MSDLDTEGHFNDTRRGAYFLAGQAIAVRRVIEGGSSNLLHLHTDHASASSA